MSKPKRRAKYTAEERNAVADQILELMKLGPAESLADACRQSGVSVGQFLTWVEKDDKELKDKYARARVALMDRMAEGLIDIADTQPALLPNGAIDSAAIAHQKLRIDTRKWLLSKLAPKKYGDKLELTGDPDRPLAIQKIERVVVDPK